MARAAAARGAGEYVIQYRSYPTHLRADLHRRAETGALVSLGTERVSYPIAHETLARVEGVPGPDELAWRRDPEELGRLGSRIKKFAKRVAKSKLGKIVKSVGKMAVSFVPGGGTALASAQVARTAIKAAKKRPAARPVRRGPAPTPVYEDEADELTEAEYEPPDYEETGATKARKAAPKPAARKAAPRPAARPAPRPTAKRAAPKAAPKAASRPVRAAPRPAARKAAAKAAPRPKSAPKPASATARAAAVAKAGGPTRALLAKAQSAPPAEAAKLQKLAILSSQIEDDAPELAASIAVAADTDRGDRDLIDARAVAAAQQLAATPAAERAEAAKVMERRLDGYKVVLPDGGVVFVPLEAVEG